MAFEIYDLTEGLQIILEKNMDLYAEGMCDMDDNNTGSTYNKTDPCDNSLLKILFIVTGAALATEPNPSGKANLVVLQLNDIYDNSRVFKRNAVVAGVESIISLTQTGNRIQDLNDWAIRSDVKDLRRDSRADIVVFLTASTYGEYNGEAKAIAAEFADSYCLVTAETAADCRFVGSHEITHLMGGTHSDGGAVPYKGYVLKRGIWPFRIERMTIMSNEYKSKPRLPYVSNPNVTFKNDPLGDATHKVFEIVTNRYDYMASYYPEAPLSIYAEFDNESWDNCNLYRTVSVNVPCGVEPFSYQWQKSFNGINWFSLTTQNTSSVTFTMPTPYPISSPTSNILIRCIVTDNVNNSYVVQRNETYYCDPVMHKTTPNITEVSTYSDFKVFPNPTNGILNLVIFSTEGSFETSVSIYNFTGQLVHYSVSKPLIQGKNEISLNLVDKNLAKGLYFVEIKSAIEVFHKSIIFN